MKKKYKAEDGFTFEASSPLEAVKIIRDSSKFDHEKTVDKYMEDFASRFEIYSGENIRFDTPENFIEDLIKTKWLEIE